MLTQALQQAIYEEIGYTFPAATRFYSSDKLSVTCQAGSLQIGVRQTCDVLRAALIAKTNAHKQAYETQENGAFEDVSFMCDCSRNAVPTVAALKKLLRNLAMLGYNSCMLYMEDVYEVDGEPYFGYLRGRYTKAEMKELDAYAVSIGMEIIPCIQTLAHLLHLKRWPEYKEHFDCQDILLVGDERVYILIDNMFKTLSSCFSTRRIHIGMDEAWQLGLGTYLDKNGYQDRFEIFLTHLDKVNQIAQKYGYQNCIMWSDMFAWTAKRVGSVDQNGEPVIPQSVVDKIPQNIQLCHWKYHGLTKEDYEPSMKLHDGFKNTLWFASGTLGWSNLLPYNTYCGAAAKASLAVAKDHGVKHVLETHWGDDGAETPLFSVLLGAARFAYHANEVPQSRLEEEFAALTGYTIEEFNALEDLNTWSGERLIDFAKNVKVALYNDVFIRIADAAIIGEHVSKFKPAVEKLASLRAKGQYAYMLEAAYALGLVVVAKYDLGMRLHKAYKAGDKAQLKALCGEMQAAAEKTDAFLCAYRKQWLTINKPQGLEVHELRLGGTATRLRCCIARLQAYLAGEIEKIEELDEEVLPPLGKPWPDGRIGSLGFDRTTSANYQRFPFLT